MIINSQLITNGKMLTKNYDSTILDDLTNPSEAIKSTQPILIIDEPHKFAKENITFQKIKDILSPQCVIRFGATFPEKKNHEKDYQNLVYNLGSIEAFDNNLVKGVIAEYVPTYSKDNVRIKLINIKNKEKLKEYPLGSQDGKLGNSKVIAKFFNPTEVGTWYIIEGKLSELESIQLPKGKYFKRDILGNEWSYFYKRGIKEKIVKVTNIF